MNDSNMDDPIRVLLAGGTTGGHLMPGVATARALQQMLPESRVLFLTADRAVEKQCEAAMAGFECVQAPATPWAGAGSKRRFPVRCARAGVRVLDIVRQFHPNAIVGLGGHNSLIPVALGRMLGIRTAIFEGNAIPGKAVRLLAPFVDQVFLQWEAAAAGLRTQRVTVTGLPVREQLFEAEKQSARRRLGLVPGKCTLLAMGGSQGAQPLNEALHGALETIGEDVQVLHLTGVDHLPAILESAANALPWYRPIGFLPRMADAYAAADFVLSRAGASTLAELTALGLPAILVPYPYAADRHQHANAAVLAGSGAALVFDQSELTVPKLALAIRSLAANAARRRRMAEQSRRLGRPGAAACIAAHLARLAGHAATARPLAVPSRQVQRKHPKAA